MTSVHIVGMGLAGSLAAWEFLKRGVRVTAWDDSSGDTSSLVAAGMITPITGQRLKPTWRGPELLARARETYGEIEQQCDVVLRREYELRRVFRNADMQEWFRRRSESGEFDVFGVREITPGELDGVVYRFGGMEHGNVLTIDIPQLMAVVRSRVAWSDQPNPGSIIIHCTGFRALSDPLWSWLPLEPSKGEILDVVIPGLDLRHVLTNGTWILPVDGDRYRIGATHDWDDHDPHPTAAARAELLAAAQSMVQHDIAVVDHRSALRPSTKFKRPLVGCHPHHSSHFVLNGLGTKGALQGPYAAAQLVACVLDGVDPDAEINIQRWWK
ncbi:MAG: FAD-binding oxidoreductase [Candidatus Kapabacteria bacterium]|nr:FAD-binding oxidoreductase [Candidatus Kapabacteria bacterium]